MCSEKKVLVVAFMVDESFHEAFAGQQNSKFVRDRMMQHENSLQEDELSSAADGSRSEAGPTIGWDEAYFKADANEKACLIFLGTSIVVLIICNILAVLIWNRGHDYLILSITTGLVLAFIWTKERLLYQYDAEE